MRVLVVEDEVKMARAIRRGLEREGYTVDAVRDGADAVTRARIRAYDAILLDLMLPAVDGLSVCRRLRAAGQWAPVLMVTARDSVDDRIAGLDAGADDYLVKPFAFGELLARLRALVRRCPAARPSVLVVGDVRLDPATREVSRAGVPVELSPREFAVLEYLLRHPGQVVTRGALRDHVWNHGYFEVSNVVDVYIGYLRKKLEQPFGRPLIRTVRGVGYAVIAP
jgi:two-component system OmpR family response regulator